MPTRFYFPEGIAPDVSPAFAAWANSGAGTRHRMVTQRLGTPLTIGPTRSIIGTQYLDRQYVSDPMAGGQVISGNAACQLMVREYAGTDNVDRLPTSLRVVSEDGQTVRATLLALGVRSTILEFINNVTHRNHSVILSTAVTSYTTQAGDRLVLEIGYGLVSGTTPQASAKWGEGDDDDLPIDNTQTIDGVGWFELSGVDLTFQPISPAAQFDAVSSAADGSAQVKTWTHVASGNGGSALIMFACPVGIQAQEVTMAQEFFAVQEGDYFEQLQVDEIGNVRTEIWGNRLTGNPITAKTYVPRILFSAACDPVAFAVTGRQVDQGTPRRAINAAVLASGTDAPDVTVMSVTDDLVVDFVATDGAVGAFTAGTDQTRRAQRVTGTLRGMVSTKAGATPEVTMASTDDNASAAAYIHQAVSLRGESTPAEQSPIFFA